MPRLLELVEKFSLAQLSVPTDADPHEGRALSAELSAPPVLQNIIARLKCVRIAP